MAHDCLAECWRRSTEPRVLHRSWIRFLWLAQRWSVYAININVVWKILAGCRWFVKVVEVVCGCAVYSRAQVALFYSGNNFVFYTIDLRRG